MQQQILSESPATARRRKLYELSQAVDLAAEGVAQARDALCVAAQAHLDAVNALNAADGEGPGLGTAQQMREDVRHAEALAMEYLAANADGAGTSPRPPDAAIYDATGDAAQDRLDAALVASLHRHDDSRAVWDRLRADPSGTTDRQISAAIYGEWQAGACGELLGRPWRASPRGDGGFWFGEEARKNPPEGPPAVGLAELVARVRRVMSLPVPRPHPDVERDLAGPAEAAGDGSWKRPVGPAPGEDQAGWEAKVRDPAQAEWERSGYARQHVSAGKASAWYAVVNVAGVGVALRYAFRFGSHASQAAPWQAYDSAAACHAVVAGALRHFLGGGDAEGPDTKKMTALADKVSGWPTAKGGPDKPPPKRQRKPKAQPVAPPATDTARGGKCCAVCCRCLKPDDRKFVHEDFVDPDTGSVDRAAVCERCAMAEDMGALLLASGAWRANLRLWSRADGSAVALAAAGACGNWCDEGVADGQRLPSEATLAEAVGGKLGRRVAVSAMCDAEGVGGRVLVVEFEPAEMPAESPAAGPRKSLFDAGAEIVLAHREGY